MDTQIQALVDTGQTEEESRRTDWICREWTRNIWWYVRNLGCSPSLQLPIFPGLASVRILAGNHLDVNILFSKFRKTSMIDHHCYREDSFFWLHCSTWINGNESWMAVKLISSTIIRFDDQGREKLNGRRNYSHRLLLTFGWIIQ